MASVTKQIRKSSKLRRKLLVSSLALTLAAPVMVSQASAAGNSDLGQYQQGDVPSFAPEEYTNYV